MAYVLDPNMDEDQQKAQQAAQGAEGQGTVLSGPSAAAPGGASGAAAKQAAPTQSGMYTNLNSYLGANEGQGARMAGDVGAHVQADATAADKAGGDWHDAAAKTIDSNRVNDTTGVTKTFSDRDNKGVAGVQQDAFNNIYNAQYLGPKNSSDALAGDQTAARAAYHKVQDAGKLAGGDDAARGALLQDTYGGDGKKYTTGENLLDSWLTGASHDAANPNGADNAFAGVAKTYGNYGDHFGDLTKDIDAQAAKAGTDTLATRDALRNAVKDYAGGINTEVNGAEARATVDNDYLAVQQALANGGDPRVLAQLGYSPDAIAAAVASKSQLGGSGYKGYTVGDRLRDPTVAAAYPHLDELLSGTGATSPLRAGVNLGTSTGDLGSRLGVDPTVANQAATTAKTTAAANTALDVDARNKAARAQADADWQAALAATATQRQAADAAKLASQPAQSNPGPLPQSTLNQINTAVSDGIGPLDLGPIVLPDGYNINLNGLGLTDDAYPGLNNYMSGK